MRTVSRTWMEEHVGVSIQLGDTHDYPGYIEQWLEWRKNGLVIMPVNKYNKDFTHTQVIPYTGQNRPEVYEALRKARDQ